MANPNPCRSLPGKSLLVLLGLWGLIVAGAGCRHTPASSAAGSPGQVSLPTLDGGVYYLGEGRQDLLVVTFFATWCMPCLAEVPYLKALHDRPGVRVVAISMDEGGRRVLEPFRDHFQIGYPILLADEELLEGRSPFGKIPGIPATFLLDHGREVHAAILGGIGPANFDPLLEKAGGPRAGGNK